MKTRRSRKTPIIVISIIISIIVLICCGIYLFIATDLFLDNRQAFFANIARSFLYTDESNVNSGKYFAKVKSTQIKNSGNLVVNINNEDIEEKILDLINNFTVDFSGNINLKDKMFSQNIILNYSEKENFPILLKKDYDEFGYKPGKIILKYVVLKQFDNSGEKVWEDEQKENPSENNMDIDSSFKERFNLGKVLPHLFDKIYYDESEIDEIKSKFVKIVEEEISKDKFKKEKNGEEKIYTIDFNEGNEFTNIHKRMISEIVNTDKMVSKINYIINDKKLNMELAEKEDIESYLENIENKDLKFKISYVKTGKQISKIIYENEFLKLSLQNDVSKNTANYVKYDLCAEFKGEQFLEGFDLMKIDLGIEYHGIEKLEKITEKYKVKISMLSEGEEKKSISYNLVNNVEFKPENKIEQFAKNEVIRLSQYTFEQEENFINELNKRTKNYKERQMLRLGLNKGEMIETYLNPIIALGEGNNNLEGPENFDDMNNFGEPENKEENSNKGEPSNNGENSNKEELPNNVETENESEVKEESKIIYTEQEKEMFNQTYKDYESEKTLGENVIRLIQKINLNNINAKDKKTQVIKITLDGNEITNEQSISKSSYYKVIAVYAENGLINEMKINTIN